MPEIKQHGGARRGAGRNPLPESEKRQAVAVKLTGEERLKLYKMKLRLGLSTSECVGLLLSLFDAQELHD
jgi:hypothetical protein